MGRTYTESKKDEKPISTHTHTHIQICSISLGIRKCISKPQQAAIIQLVKWLKWKTLTTLNVGDNVE